MSPRAKENSVKASLFVSPEVYQKLKDKAEEKGTTISGLIRMIVMEWLRK